MNNLPKQHSHEVALLLFPQAPTDGSDHGAFHLDQTRECIRYDYCVISRPLKTELRLLKLDRFFGFENLRKEECFPSQSMRPTHSHAQNNMDCRKSFSTSVSICELHFISIFMLPAAIAMHRRLVANQSSWATQLLYCVASGQCLRVENIPKLEPSPLECHLVSLSTPIYASGTHSLSS